MPPRLQAARDQLASVLARRSPVDAASLARELGVSVPTLHRLLADLGPGLVTAGRARRARYALRRPVRGTVANLPLYEIDLVGQANPAGSVCLLHPHGSWGDLRAAGWPVPQESMDGWWSGLPYPLYDMRPQGYLGRQFAVREYRTLGVAPNPREWSDEDVLHVLAHSGSDVTGSLILGDRTFEAWLERKLHPPEPVAVSRVAKAYTALADEAVAAGVPGSSAAGEFPKFPAQRVLAGAGTPHVIVKFSGADDSAAVRRWADLLVCEHLALRALGGIDDLAIASTRVLSHSGRTFLESERFDRHGAFGRSRLVSLEVVNGAFLGDATSDWSRLASRLNEAGLLSPDDARKVATVWWFGRLIANTDMHLGNLSFRVADAFSIAPVYDMLPMAYAPMPGGEVPVRAFDPPAPLPAQRSVWLSAARGAHAFWVAAAADSRIRESFRAICARNADALVRLAEKV